MAQLATSLNLKKKKKHPQLLLIKSLKVKNSVGCDKIRFDRQWFSTTSQLASSLDQNAAQTALTLAEDSIFIKDS